MKQSKSPRTPSQLSDSVHHQLSMYALAASAAGVERLNVKVVRPPNAPITAILTGYAYETTANKPIIAVKTKGPDVITLGHLAAGASARWRSVTGQ